MVFQDLPPPNGFGTISTARVLPKPIIKQSILFVGAILATWHGLVFASQWRKRLLILKMEQMEHYIATVPFLIAEQERKYLLRLRQIREFERETMKDEPGWIVGTLYGEKVYKTLHKDQLPNVNFKEFIMCRGMDEWIYEVKSPYTWR